MQTVILMAGVLIIGILVIMYRTDKELEEVRRRTQSYLKEHQPDNK